MRPGFACSIALLGIPFCVPSMSAQAPPTAPTCFIGGVAITPTLSLVDATTKSQTVSGGVTLLATRPAVCGVMHRFLVVTGSKYDSKQKENAPANITRHHNATVQYLGQPTQTSPYWSLSGAYLADNSLGLYLQQTYTVAIGKILDFGPVAVDLSAGPALMGQHFSTGVDTSTRFVAPSYSIRLSYSTPVNPPQPASGCPPPPPPPPAVEFEVMRTHVVSLDGKPSQSTVQGAVRVPTALKPLSFQIKAWLDQVSNAPAGFKNHYFTVEFGPKIAIGTVP